MQNWGRKYIRWSLKIKSKKSKEVLETSTRVNSVEFKLVGVVVGQKEREYRKQVPR